MKRYGYTFTTFIFLVVFIPISGFAQVLNQNPFGDKLPFFIDACVWNPHHNVFMCVQPDECNTQPGGAAQCAPVPCTAKTMYITPEGKTGQWGGTAVGFCQPAPKGTVSKCICKESYSPHNIDLQRFGLVIPESK